MPGKSQEAADGELRAPAPSLLERLDALGALNPRLMVAATAIAAAIAAVALLSQAQGTIVLYQAF